MRIDPDDAEPLAPCGEMRGRAGDRAGRERVVAPEHDRDLPVLERGAHLRRDVGADVSDGAEVARAALRALGGVLAERDGDVASILDGVPELLERVPEVGVANGGGTHVHAAARGAEVHGDADDSYVSHESGRLSAGT